MLRAFKIRLCSIYALYLPSLIAIFAQERERGCFNPARDGASRNVEKATAEARQSKAEHGGALREPRQSREERRESTPEQQLP